MIMRQNMFDGDSYHAQYAIKVYKQLMARETVTYESVVKEYFGDKYNPQKHTLTKVEGYGELKKAFSDVCKAIKKAAGEHSIEMSGRNRCKEESGRRGYRYVGTDEDPLKDMVNARAIKDLEEYRSFCQDTAGFLPEEWLDYFLKGTKDLLEIHKRNRNKKLIMGTAVAYRNLENKELIPQLYRDIKNQTVLSVMYKSGYDDDKREQLVFHPHYLREFNGRWFLFGYAEGKEKENGYNLAVDRIECKPVRLLDKKWRGAPEGFYEDYFRDIVGVSHWENSKPCHVVLRAHSKYMFGLVKTCPLHHSQKIVTDFGEHDGKEYGEFELYVELNNELIGRILQKGEKLEVISPLDVREKVKKEVRDIMSRYES